MKTLYPFILIFLIFSSCSHENKCTTPSSGNQKQVVSKTKTVKPVAIAPLPYSLKASRAATGTFAGSTIRSIKWSPDGKYLGFLKTDANNLTELWGFDIKSRKLIPLIKSSELVKQIKETAKDKADRERKRISYRGIVSYEWSADSKRVLFSLSGNVYIYIFKSKKAISVYSAKKGERITEARFAPGSSDMIAFVRNGALTILKIRKIRNSKADVTIKTVPGQKPTKTRYYGLSEFIAGEEMSRYRGYWWSPSSTPGKFALVYTEVDESAVPVRKRPAIGAQAFGIVSQRYPSVGKPNAKVILHVYSGKLIGKSKRKKLRTSSKTVIPGKYEYIPRVYWINDDYFAVETQNRTQTELNLYLCNTEGQCGKVLQDKDKAWVELNDDPVFSKDGKYMVLSTENPAITGNKSPSRKRALAVFKLTEIQKGKKLEFKAEKIKILKMKKGEALHKLHSVNFKTNEIYYSVYKNEGFDLGFLSRNFKTGKTVSLIKSGGWHSVTVSPDLKFFVDRYSSINTPELLEIRNMHGKYVTIMPPLTKASPLLSRLPVPEQVSVPLNNQVKLNGLLFKPGNYNPAIRYPVIIYGYGGPHGHVAVNRLSKYHFWSQYMADKGFLVLMVDGRGGLYKNYAFAKAPYKNFGKFEVEDHLAAAKYMAARKDVKKDKIGIWGWSYGGYMALATLLSKNNMFAAGVAVAPPTDWTLYDTHYTERYLGTDPSSETYANSKIDLKKLKNLKVPLMIVHGMSDDNVLLINSLRIIKTMQDNAIQFELMLYPGKAHSIWGANTRTHLLKHITSFFIRTLR